MCSTMIDNDHHFMTIALKLAENNLGCVAPNPSVGCVIVKNGAVIGEGSTGIGGRPHAEVVALKNITDSIDDSTIMYVTLEPCCHYGVTPPCTDVIIRSGIKWVVAATIDPDKRVFGAGINALREAGIQVKQGVMREEAEKQNIGFFITKTLSRPFIAVKIAATLDGKIAAYTGNSKWISSEQARKWVHQQRSKYDAIMIGSNTLVMDDPLLTCRIPGLEDKSPMRLIVDSKGKLRNEHKITKITGQATTWVVTNKEVESKIKNVNYLKVNSNAAALRESSQCPDREVPESTATDKVCLKDMVEKLVSRIGITRLLVEGGGGLITELLKLNLIDRLIICRSGKLLGNDAVPSIGNLGIPSISKCYQFKKAEIIDLDEDIIEVWDRLL